MEDSSKKGSHRHAGGFSHPAFTGRIGVGRIDITPRGEMTQIHVRHQVNNLPLREWPSLHELDILHQQETSHALRERLSRKINLRREIGDGDSLPTPMWIWKIGEIIIVGHPNEAYSYLQTELRRRFPERILAVMNLVNGTLGCFPPSDFYQLDIYPVWQNPLAAGCLENLVEAAADAVKELTTL